MLLESYFLSVDRDFDYKSIVFPAGFVPLTDNLSIVGVVDDRAAFNAAVATAEANIGNGAWFRFSESNSPNWQIRIKNSNDALDKTVDSGVAVVAGINARVLFQIKYAVATKIVTFFINGTLVHTEDMTLKFGSALLPLFQLIAEAAVNPGLVCESLYVKSTRI